MWEYSRLLYGLLLVPHNIIMDSNNDLNVEIFKNILWNIVSPTKHCYGFE